MMLNSIFKINYSFFWRKKNQKRLLIENILWWTVGWLSLQINYKHAVGTGFRPSTRIIKQTILLFVLYISISGISSAQTVDRPLILPVQAPPSPSTWLLGQPYGNTIGAFNRADDWYSAGQGLHFGIDFSMPCGTALVAVADAEVMFVDDFGFGSRPHNLILKHGALGLVSLYGHLLQKPDLVPGQFVTQGQVVGYSGDPDETCVSRPHLHYELRSLDYFTTYNPVLYMDANWNTLTTIGSFSYPMFEQNLDNARQWLNLDDQPNVSFGGRRLNNYALAYPSSVRAPANPPLDRSFSLLPDNPQIELRQLGYDSCCQRFWWSATNADLFYVIDGGANSRAGIFEWSLSAGAPTVNVTAAPPMPRSPDGQYEVGFIDNRTYLKRLTDGTLTPTPVMNRFPAISPRNTHLMWIEQEPTSNFEEGPISNIYVSNFDGSASRIIFSDLGAGAIWLDDNRLLISVQNRPALTLSVLNVLDGSFATLGTWEYLRHLSVSPGGKRLMFYLTSQGDDSINGIYSIETQANAKAQKMNWFGGWQWRDSDSVYYIPYDTNSDIHQLAYYHIPTANNRILTDKTTQAFTVMNGEWAVSPDGRHILFFNAINRNLWVLSLINA